jgi:hypothetical protein
MLLKYAQKLHLVSLLFLGGLTLAAHADLKPPVGKPDKDNKEDKDAPVLERAPVPQPVKVTVNRGETVEITLSALTASNKDVQFILRTAPAAGKLLDAEPVRKSKTTAVLRYQSDPASKVMRDEFKFAARVIGGSVSTAESVTITLQEIKPELTVPDKLEGGQIRCGQSTTVVLPIKNTGNGSFTQSVTLPHGWALAPGEKWEVPAGKTVEVKLIYTPTGLGISEHVLQLNEKTRITLSGIGLLPVEIPTHVTLKWDAATARRHVTVPVRNTMGTPLTVKFSGIIPDLEYPKEITLAPQASGSFELNLGGLPAAPLQSVLEVTVQGLTQNLSLNAERAPAQIALAGAGAENFIDFANVDALKLPTTTKSLTLSNTGGTPATVYGVMPESFLLDGFTDGITLQPGMEVPILIRFKPTAVGTLKNSAQFKWDKSAITLSLWANIIPDANATTRVMDAPSNLSGDPTADMDPMNATDTKSVDREMNINRAGLLPKGFVIDRGIPMLAAIPELKDPGVYLKSATKESLTLAWKPLPKPATGPDYDYVVLYRVVKAINGYPRTIWTLYPKTVVTRTGDEATVILRGIGPGWRNQLRVAAKSSTGLYGQPSIPFEYGIPNEEEPFDWAFWAYIALAVGVITLIFLRVRSRKNSFVPRRYVPRIEGETEV